MQHSFPTDATFAEYFRRGLELDMIAEGEVHSWAAAEIASRSNPPFEFIEVAWSKNVNQLLQALSSFHGPRDVRLAGAWLFDLLQRQVLPTSEVVAQAIRRAMNIARLCGFEDDVYYAFDTIDDAFYLARHGQYGSVPKCKADLAALLCKHAQPLPSKSEA